MWLQRFTNKKRLAAGVLALLMLAGCGGSAGVRDTAKA